MHHSKRQLTLLGTIFSFQTCRISTCCQSSLCLRLMKKVHSLGRDTQGSNWHPRITALLGIATRDFKISDPGFLIEDIRQTFRRNTWSSSWYRYWTVSVLCLLNRGSGVQKDSLFFVDSGQFAKCSEACRYYRPVVLLRRNELKQNWIVFV